jgi:hypothetical protein
MNYIKPYYSYKKDAYQELVFSFTSYLEKVSPLYNLVKSMNKESNLMFSLSTKNQNDFVPRILEVSISGSSRSALLLQISLDEDRTVLVNSGNGQMPEKLQLSAADYSFIAKRFYELARVGEEIPKTLYRFVANHYSSQVCYYSDDSSLCLVVFASKDDIKYYGGIMNV